MTALQGGHCKAEKWGPSAADLKVTVRCFRAGKPTSLRYAASFFTNTAIGISRWKFRHGGFALATQPTATTSYRAPSSFASSGQPVSVTRLSAGAYRLGFSGLPPATAAAALVMAYGADDARCWSTSSSNPLAVSCNRDTRFIALYLTNQSATLPPEQRVDFGCQKNDSNAGCQSMAHCPAGKHITRLKAACNLESGSVTDAQLSTVPENALRVLKPSSTVHEGRCWTNTAVTSSGTIAASGVGYQSVTAGCRERDDNGGDCQIKGTMYCR